MQGVTLLHHFSPYIGEPKLALPVPTSQGCRICSNRFC